jgi:hypothetical protein
MSATVCIIHVKFLFEHVEVDFGSSFNVNLAVLIESYVILVSRVDIYWWRIRGSCSAVEIFIEFYFIFVNFCVGESTFFLILCYFF